MSNGKARGCDVRDPAAVAAARKELYAEVENGLTAELASFKDDIAAGDDVRIIRRLQLIAENVRYFGGVLAEIAAKKAVYEYLQAGGELPRTLGEGMQLAEQLFPTAGPAPSPAIVAQNAHGASSVGADSAHGEREPPMSQAN
jgi:hypothetical protein